MIRPLVAILIAGLSGFVALSYEILWYRTFSLSTGGTAPVFAFVLGSYLYGLAAGSFVAAAFPELGRAAVFAVFFVAPCTAGLAETALVTAALFAAVPLTSALLAAFFLAAAFFAGVFRAVALLAAALPAAGCFAVFLPVDAGMRALAMLPPPSCGRGRDGDSDSTAGIHSG